MRRLAPKGKREIDKREKTAGCLPLARPPRRRRFLCFGKAPSLRWKPHIPPQDGLDKWVALFTGWIPLDDLEARERADHAPYRDWIRAGFIRGCPGDVIDYEDVIDTIVQAAEMYDLRIIGFDPYLSATLTQRIAARLVGKPTQVVEIPQGIKSISPPMKEMETLIRTHAMLHVHNTAARACFANVRLVTDDNENIKPTKKRSRGRIDITVSWIIAFATSKLDAGPSINEKVQAEDWSLC